MKPHYKHLATALAATLQLAALAAVPLSWDARPGQPAPASFDRYHGEALEFRCTFRGFGELPFVPGADIRLWYQTNGMGQAWWSVPATIQSNVLSATWSPELDPGADRVSLFFGAPSNAYASAVLRLRHSPGFAPGAMPDPESFHESDPVFAAWLSTYTPPDTSLEPATNYTDRALGEFASTGTVFRAATYGTQTLWTDATGCVWEVNEKRSWTYQTDPPGVDVFLSGLNIEWNDGTYEGLPYYAPIGWFTMNGPNYFGDDVNAYRFEYFGSYWDDALEEIKEVDIVATRNPITNLVTRVAYTNDIPAETDPSVPGWAKEPSPPSYSAADVGAAPASIVPVLTSVSNDAATAKLNAASALRIVLGESVWFAVTNHMRTAKGVIPSLQLWEVRDSVTNLVYDSREEITNTVKALTRELHTELTNRIHDVEKTIPSKAWGNYQSDGTDNPEPGKVAIVNQPTVILTGGGTFNKYVEIGDSSIWVLASSGPVSFGGGGANGNYFAVLDDEGNAHFKVSKTDSFDVGAIFTDDPRTSGDALLLYVCSTNRQGEAYIGPPTLSACTNLQAAVWHDEADGEIDALGTSVAWARNDTIHAWVGTVTQDRWATAMFFRAKMKQEGGTAIINTAPVRFDGGIQLGNGKYRLVPYTTGGKTYLTVEGLP